MKLKLSTLRDVCAGRPGMWEAFQASGQVQGDYLALAREDFGRLKEEWLPGIGLGRKAHAVLGPAAEAIDKLLGTDVKNCSGCAGRELKLDAIMVFKAPVTGG